MTTWAIAKEPVDPITPAREIDLAQVELGKQLYFDPRLSKSGFISCNSSHNLSMGVVEPYVTNNPAKGRIAVTGKDEDRFR